MKKEQREKILNNDLVSRTYLFLMFCLHFPASICLSKQNTLYLIGYMLYFYILFIQNTLVYGQRVEIYFQFPSHINLFAEPRDIIISYSSARDTCVTCVYLASTILGLWCILYVLYVKMENGRQADSQTRRTTLFKKTFE